jgi:oxygen-independent coproporphyrinogen-3 oxidase
MINIFLNKLEYRYDVYQIFNLYYNYDDINFVDNDADITILLDDNSMVIKDNIQSYEYALDGRSYKEEIRLAIFSFLKNKIGKEFPWGTMIGIRPSKIALSLLSRGKSEEEIIEYYDEHFKTKRSKAELCINVAKTESNLINIDSNSVSIYIGMPFCPTRCSYCSFAANSIISCGSLVEPYLAALQKEIFSIRKFVDEKDLKIECVYFGGGTPTAINDAQFDNIMRCIYDNFISQRKVREFTVECGRPDSITESKLNSMKMNKVHRISINPQTMNNDTLKRIGRHHSAEDVINKFNMARKMGFDSINMDIIVGLSGENLSHIENTCREIFKLNPESITVHGLSIKRASRLHEAKANHSSAEQLEQDEINKMYERTSELAGSLDMKPYYMYRQKNMFGNMENIGYAKSSKEGIYNIQMIEEKQTIISAGADAVSKIVFLDENRIERFANVKDVKEYVTRIDEMINKKHQLLNSLYK